MGITGPKMSLAKLKQGAEHTTKGTRKVALPGVKTDADSMDQAAYKANRKLAKKISDAYRSLKPGDEAGSPWLLGWRLYPNKDHPAWKKGRKDHFCGCGCGGVGQPHPPKAAGKGKSKGRKKAKS